MAVTTPALPATLVPVPNQTGQFVDVAIVGGTMTNVSIIGQTGVSTTVGAGAGNYALPPGCFIVMTFSVAPTSWAWTDPEQTGYLPVYSAENLTLVNEEGQLPWPAHAEGGETGLGEAVSN